MIALSSQSIVTQQVFDILASPSHGEIMLVTSKGTYLQLGSHILHLTAAHFGVTPLGIGMENYSDIEKLLLAPGDSLTWDGGTLYTPKGTISFCLQTFPESKAYALPCKNTVLECANSLYKAANPKGLASLAGTFFLSMSHHDTPLCRRAYALLTSLVDGLREDHREVIFPAVSYLLGLGIGLTPSGDDVMLGFLYGLLRLAPSKAGILQEAIETYACNSTHPISAAYLLAVVKGSEFERLNHILHGLSGKIPLDISPMLEIGSSSGTEMLLGILLSTKILS